MNPWQTLDPVLATPPIRQGDPGSSPVNPLMRFLEDRDATGCLPSPPMTLTPQPSLLGSAISRGSWRLGRRMDSSIGSSLPSIQRRSRSSLSNGTSETLVMPSSPVRQLPTSTSGRRTPESMGHNLNSEQSPPEETTPTTGMPSGNLPSEEIWNPFRRAFEFKVIGLCDQSLPILQNHLEWSELVTYSGVHLELASHGELGQRLEWMLTLKIRGQSSGAGIVARRMLCLTNLEEESTSVTYSDGSIVTLSMWNLKEAQLVCSPLVSGSHRMFNPQPGTPSWMMQHWPPSYDV